MRAGLALVVVDDSAGLLVVVEGMAVDEVPGVVVVVVLEMDFISPVVGMERARAKNSAVRSVMVVIDWECCVVELRGGLMRLA